MSNPGLTERFNQSILQMTDAQKAVVKREGEIVMVFDHDAKSADVAAAVVDAYEKTGAEYIYMVSRSRDADGAVQCRTAGTVAQLNGAKHLEDIAEKWEALSKPLTVNPLITVALPASADMTEEDIIKAVRKSLLSAAPEAARLVQQALEQRHECEARANKDTHALAYRALSAQAGHDVDVFLYGRWKETLVQLQNEMRDTAETLQMPVGYGYEGKTVTAFPQNKKRPGLAG